jgi:hypothetical protein
MSTARFVGCVAILVLASACGGSSADPDGGLADSGAVPDSGLLPDGGELACGSQTACGLTCVDVSSDPDNCGACARSCQGGGCASGSCQPVMLASGEDQPIRLTANGGWLYWTDYGSGEVKRVPVSGGAVETLASGQRDLSGLCADGTHVYWIVSLGADAGIWSATLDGGAPVQLAAGSPSNTVVHIGDRLYWGDRFSKEIMTLGVDGGSGASWSLGAVATDIASDGTQLFWGGYSNALASQGGIFRSSLDGGSIEGRLDGLDGGIEQVAPAHIPARIALGPGLVGWLEATFYQTPEGHYDDAGIWIAPLDGGEPRQVAPLAGQNYTTLSGGQGLTGGLASDEDYLYWTDLTAGVVARAPWDGGVAQPLAQGQERPVGLTTDETSLYWSTFGSDGGGMIMKLAR